MTPIHPPSGACGPSGAWPRRVSASVARRGDARGGKGRREAGPRRPFGAVRLNLRLPRPPSPTRGRGAGEEGSPRQVRSAGASGGTVRPRRGPLPRSRRESKGNGGVRGCDRHGVPWTPTGSRGSRGAQGRTRAFIRSGNSVRKLSSTTPAQARRRARDGFGPSVPRANGVGLSGLGPGFRGVGRVGIDPTAVTGGSPITGSGAPRSGPGRPPSGRGARRPGASSRVQAMLEGGRGVESRGPY